MLGATGPALFVVCVAHLFDVMVCYDAAAADDDDANEDKQMTNVV